MLTPRPTIRAVAARIYNKGDRERQGAAVVGPAPTALVHTINDEENQHAFATSGDDRGGFRAPELPQVGPSAGDTQPPGSAVDAVNEKQISIFTFMKIATVLSALYMAADPWLYIYFRDAGFNMCPRMVLCTSNLTEMLLLTGSRLSAGTLYSSLTISIFSKCYATRSLLHNSWFGTVVDFEPSHDIHTYFGYLSLVAAFEHAILHCARFTYGGEAYIIYHTDNGRSGVIACLLILPIVLPMKFEFFKTKMSFQFRKSLHVLFLPLMVALCFHSATFRYVGTIVIVWYTLDRVYFTTKQTFLIDHPLFEAVGRGTMVTIDLPMGYTFKAGSYIYVNSPMISRNEWHPFSIIQLPGDLPRATFYAEAVGDWTQELFRLGLDKPRLPLWITAAQPSLMEKSIYYEKLVLVCTGAGITPAVSIIERFSNRKTIHLLWMTRDCGMVALFEKQVRKVSSTVHLTGKPTDEKKEALRRLLKPSEFTGPDSAGKTSFREIVANGALSLSTPQRAAHLRDAAGAHVPTAHDDDKDQDTLPEEQKELPERTTRTRSRATQRNQRISSMTVENADPITLEFGRPDIAEYLTETFDVGGGKSRTDPDGPLLKAYRPQEEGASSSVGGTDIPKGMLMRQVSARLDDSQKVSKFSLMQADSSVVETWPQPPAKHGLSGRVATGGPVGMASHSVCHLPWLVLYCGANPKVEEAIAKTCGELGVNWQKEYFGAW